ncbi:MAG: type II toxin-antitoxin system VapC family toxin [Anaerolineales bacterium]
MERIVLDAYALMAFFENEKGADQVHHYLVRAMHDEVKLFLSVVNLGEIWYSFAHTNSPEIADKYIDEIVSLSIEIIDINWPIAHFAAIFKVQGKIAYADCFAAALAKTLQAKLRTADPEFKQLENEIQIEWLE